MEIAKTILKVLVIAFVYLGVGPLLAKWLQGRDRARRVVLGLLGAWIVRPRSNFTLTLYSIEDYRGHARGFEFNFLEAIAIALSLAAILERRKDFRWFMPGLLPWLLWIFLSCLSVANAIDPLYVWMPAFKVLTIAAVMAGVFHAIHDMRDIRALMRGFAIALIVQLVVCLWFRYVQGAFRVIGWFEHQNPMAMWSYTLAMPLLGLALAKETTRRDMLLFLAAFGAAGLVVLLTVSRASLAFFALGTVLVMAASFLQGVTVRRASLAVALAIGGTAAMAMAMDTFMARMAGAGDDSPENDLRYVLNLQSATMLEDHPAVGIGWNNYGLANSRPMGTRYSEILEAWEANRGHAIYPEQFEANPLTESLYWLMLAENGILGFAGFMIVIAVSMWFGLRNSWHFWKSPAGLFVFGILVTLLITYLHGRVERVLTQTKNLTTWVIFLGVLARFEWWRRQKTPEESIFPK